MVDCSAVVTAAAVDDGDGAAAAGWLGSGSELEASDSCQAAKQVEVGRVKGQLSPPSPPGPRRQPGRKSHRQRRETRRADDQQRNVEDDDDGWMSFSGRGDEWMDNCKE